jgi:hypothetical protein
MTKLAVTSFILNVASKKDLETMNPFLHVSFILIILLFLFLNYLVFFKTSDEKIYENAKKTPRLIYTLLGKTFYLIYYKITVVGGLVLTIVAYIIFILYVTGHLEPL